MPTPPLKSKEELCEMDHKELVEYANERQQAAYSIWESMIYL
jgi:hypothetical protein